MAVSESIELPLDGTIRMVCLSQNRKEEEERDLYQTNTTLKVTFFSIATRLVIYSSKCSNIAVNFTTSPNHLP